MKVTQLCLTLCDPMDYKVHGILQARILKWVAFPFFRNLPNPGIKPRSPALQADFLPAEPQGKPKNTGVGSLFLLQQIFPPWNWTGVSCIAGRFFTKWAIRNICKHIWIHTYILTILKGFFFPFHEVLIYKAEFLMIITRICWSHSQWKPYISF